jgi:hypothetical protein
MLLRSCYIASIALVVMCLLPITLIAQDTVPPAGRVRWLSWQETEHSPRRAAILSAIVPGTGQAYNRKYWKMPIVYAAGITGGYLISSNHKEWKIYRQAYIFRTDDDPDTMDDFPNYTAQQLRVFRDYYRRNMELSVMLSTAVYLLQILDATVDAHLFDFDVSNNLALRFEPFVIPAFAGSDRGVIAGGSLSLRFLHRRGGRLPVSPFLADGKVFRMQ